MLEVPEGLAEELVSVLALGSLGARIGEATGGRSRLEIYLPSPADADKAKRTAEIVLRRAGLDPAACGLCRAEIPDGRWVEAYQAGLEPFRLGNRFMIQAGARGAVPEGPGRIVLAPGRAFGTGEHPTTQLCAIELEGRVRRGSRWLDLGCGTAILSVVAQRCGAAEVLALDHDETAVEVARGVVRDNGAEPAVRVREGSVADAEPGGWDGVVCNISAPFLMEHAAELAALLRPEGSLIAAGFLDEDLPRVRGALREAALDEAARESRDSWAVLVMRRL